MVRIRLAGNSVQSSRVQDHVGRADTAALAELEALADDGVGVSEESCAMTLIAAESVRSVLK